ncbi:DUF3316 domain-containing protein [Psychromonas ossibalaenae]|uniref:DUF3316 domain-containing protein n=1 Tax=Psychromonas ossibalaenae TaxID=444922 RepID=UPI0003817CC3|nr:DUF3316 domain-containing protein [Psychromonas ossibalaenae]
MKKLLLASLLTSVFSINVFAAPTFATSNKMLLGQSISSKDAAFQAGHELVSDLNAMSKKELRETLGVSRFSMENQNIIINDTFVTVNELSTVPSVIEYQPVVGIEYKYQEKLNVHR